MKHKPVPIGVVLTGVIYFGLLFYWQWDELQGEGAARDAAIFGIVLAVAHVAYVMACFQRDLPASMKQLPIIGRYAKLYGWLIFVFIAVEAAIDMFS